MIKVFESITALKKAATKREAEKKELADVVEQEKLIEMKGERLLANLQCANTDCRSAPICSQRCLPSTSDRGQEGRRKP